MGFDMPRWSHYLSEWEDNAIKAGATPVDILEMYYLRQGCLLPRVKVAEIRAMMGWECPGALDQKLEQIISLLRGDEG